jgi:hypothetical protein
MRIPLAFAALCLCACRMPWQPAGRACADGASLALPIDLDRFAGKGSVWPFGAHGGPHPEGHPGVDFLLDSADARGTIAVKASYTAEIISITPETDNPGASCIVMDSACVEVNLCHVVLDPALKPGGKVARGQALGTVALIAAEGRYSLHFGTYSGPDADLACPADFLADDTAVCRLGLAAGSPAPAFCGGMLSNIPDTVTWMGRSLYPEREARSMTVACTDGSSQIFALPAETGFCNARLSASDRARMNACLGSACAGVW